MIFVQHQNLDSLRILPIDLVVLRLAVTLRRKYKYCGITHPSRFHTPFPSYSSIPSRPLYLLNLLFHSINQLKMSTVPNSLVTNLVFLS